MISKINIKKSSCIRIEKKIVTSSFYFKIKKKKIIRKIKRILLLKVKMMSKRGLNGCISIIIVLTASGLCSARSGLYSEESPSPSVRIEQCHGGCIKKVKKYTIF